MVLVVFDVEVCVLMPLFFMTTLLSTPFCLLFCAKFFRIWKQNHPLNWVRFFYPMFANCVHANIGSMLTLLKVKFFYQIVANLPLNATNS